MPLENDPIENEWYEIPDKDQAFCVVTVDEDEDIIEIQYYDGTIEELDFEAWEDLNPDPIEAPEDWIGPYDEDEEEDHDYGDEETEEDEWEEPFDA